MAKLDRHFRAGMSNSFGAVGRIYTLRFHAATRTRQFCTYRYNRKLNFLFIHTTTTRRNLKSIQAC